MTQAAVCKEEVPVVNSPNQSRIEDSNTSDWYERLTVEQRIFLWLASAILVFVYGIGLIPVAILLFKELGKPAKTGFYKSSYGRVLLGADVRNLASEERTRSNITHGVLVTGVIYDSPAFSSTIIPGDIITAINGHSIYSPSVQSELLLRLAGQLVTINLERVGQSHELKVQLNA